MVGPTDQVERGGFRLELPTSHPHKFGNYSTVPALKVRHENILNCSVQNVQTLSPLRFLEGQNLSIVLSVGQTADTPQLSVREGRTPKEC